MPTQLHKAYELAKGPPAVPWKTYVRQAERKWRELLADPSVGEKDDQLFLEQNPSFVPGAFGVEGPANHGPTIGALITQPRLPGLTRPVPDFMWINKQSDRIFVVLIEIEDPHKRWFTTKGSATAQLSQTMGQIAEWKGWFAQNGNVAQFRNLYWLRRDWWARLPMFVRYVLVYGRAAEFDGRDDLSRLRSGIAPEDTTIMTYDRVQPFGIGTDFPCAKVAGDQLVAKWFPPAFSIDPYHVEEGIARLAGKEEAVLASPGIPEDRKNFLISRFRYWDGWAKEHPQGIFALQDVE